jgi:hypothetical protein
VNAAAAAFGATAQLTRLKDAEAYRPQSAPAMYQTFELYLREAAPAPPRFEPLTCLTTLEVMERARGILAADTAVASVEVRLAGQHLFTLER